MQHSTFFLTTNGPGSISTVSAARRRRGHKSCSLPTKPRRTLSSSPRGQRCKKEVRSLLKTTPAGIVGWPDAPIHRSHLSHLRDELDEGAQTRSIDPTVRHGPSRSLSPVFHFCGPGQIRRPESPSATEPTARGGSLRPTVSCLGLRPIVEASQAYAS